MQAQFFSSSHWRQSGAMFGMDARIALIIAAILTAAGGYAYMSRIESAKTEQAEAQSQMLVQAVGRYYAEISTAKLPDTLDEVLASSILTDPTIKTDPWGKPWEYSRTSAQVQYEGAPMTLQLAAVWSRGKNGVNDSSALISDADFAQWAPGKDDLGTKYTSRDIELKRSSNRRNQAEQILEAFNTYSDNGYLEAQAVCEGTEPPEWCGLGTEQSYGQFNFYPRTDADSTANVVYYTDRVKAKATYASGQLADMEQLMVDLGLPASFARDDWGNVLMINPNSSGRTNPTYSVTLCYAASGENCLQK